MRNARETGNPGSNGMNYFISQKNGVPENGFCDVLPLRRYLIVILKQIDISFFFQCRYQTGRQRMRPAQFSLSERHKNAKISPLIGIDCNPRNTGDGNPCLFQGRQQQTSNNTRTRNNLKKRETGSSNTITATDSGRHGQVRGGKREQTTKSYTTMTGFRANHSDDIEAKRLAVI